jgi:large subunit ribosomal protein L13
MTTFMQKSADITRDWYVIDATDQVLGRLAAKAAAMLRGKNKPTFTPHIDGGDFIIIINASKINLTGDKLNKKIYYNHSGYPGGLRERTAKVMRDKYPVEMIERAINGMLPNGRLGSAMSKKLFVYEGSTHPHLAQKPEVLEIK